MSDAIPNLGIPNTKKKAKSGVARLLPWHQNNGIYQIYIEPLATVKDATGGSEVNNI